MSRVGADIYDAGSNPPPTRTWIGDDGEVQTEKLPAQPWKMMLDISGHVRRFVLTTGAALRDRNSTYGLNKIAAMEAAGAVPFYECPMHRASTAAWVPKDIRKDACDHASFGQKLGGIHGTPCKHVAEMETRRKAKNAAFALKEAEKQKSVEQKAYELHKAQAEKQALVPTLSPADIAAAVAVALADRDEERAAAVATKPAPKKKAKSGD